MNKIIFRLGLIIIVVLTLSCLFLPVDVLAQCPMCKMTAESDLKNGGSEGSGLNIGIGYILSFPYILLASVGTIWYMNHLKVQRYEQDRDLRSLLEPLDE